MSVTVRMQQIWDAAPEVYKIVIASGGDLKTLNDVLVEKYYNDPNTGRDAFGGIGAVALGALGAVIGAAVFPATFAGVGAIAVGYVFGQIGDESGKQLWDLMTSPEFQKMVNIAYRDIAPANSGNSTDTLITTLQTKFGTAEITKSPLILDLDGDGVETVSKSAGIHFDQDKNGFAETSGWVGKDDGLLVMDRNGNGSIDDGSELFGNNTVLANGQKAANGFEALKDLDGNKDGKVDASDAAYAKLRVWKDTNQDGVTQAGELLTLAQAGVKSLATGYTNQSVTDAQGNQHLQAGSFTRTDGTTAKVDDVWFAVDTARTADKALVAVSADIALLPDLAGFGNVHSLHQAMARDTSGRLKSLVQQYAGTTDPTARKAVLTTLIYAWAGVEKVDPLSRAANDHQWRDVA